MNKVNIKGVDQLDNYTATKNIITSFWEDKKWLEELETWVRNLKLEVKEKELLEYIDMIRCYAWKRIEEIIFNIC
jgi:hypothetical protein